MARRNAEGYPILPSRLLLAASDETPAQNRRWRFFGDHETTGEDEGTHIQGAGPAIHEQLPRCLEVPAPEGLHPVVALSVTDFRIYLECPYRFYLQRVLRLEATEEPQQELDGRAFGNLLHDVLEQFGLSEACDSDDDSLISQFFLDELSSRFAFLYGKRPRPSLQIQRKQLQQWLCRVCSENKRSGDLRRAGKSFRRKWKHKRVSHRGVICIPKWPCEVEWIELIGMRSRDNMPSWTINRRTRRCLREGRITDGPQRIFWRWLVKIG